ncbi:MAG: SpoIIE family protein phosphatase [Acidobacteriaceae bacterium]|nr:SpoIIE family protein phosphatase [Acidobacteriaceae bacterium]MBV9297235.1 SpoIIE family protein phosphatase [Acidobacteriaceae bacterium]MBV9778326.1 SpoIIE family protein phosphatase [Acidobacteriaceae bacterium]
MASTKFGVNLKGARHSENVYWSRLPARRMWKLLVALFFSMGTMGFFVDLIGWGLLSIPEALGWVTLCGAFSVAIFLAATKHRKLIPVVVIAYVICTFSLASRPHRPRLPALARAARVRITFDDIGLMASALIGYIFFNAFVRSEGAEMAALQTELALAHRLQEMLVPTLELSTDNFELFAKTIPSEKVGGDLVDAFESGLSITTYVADVSGHGIAAGTLMGMIKMGVRLYATQAGGEVDPGSLMDALNRALPSVKEPNMFATVACITARPGGQVAFSIAGHGPILHYCSCTRSISHLHLAQFPLGLFPSTYVPESTRMSRGDVLAICTDGILEAENRAGVEFGSAELEKIVIENAQEQLSTMFARVAAAVYRHCPKPEDDCSLLLLRYRG